MRIALGRGMSRILHLIALFITVSAVSACSYLPPVALEATPADLEMLAGQWVGEYDSVALGRRGSLEFKLAAGTDEAYGAVLMVPRGQVLPYQSEPYREGPAQSRDPFNTELLTIKFIRASNGSITGMLDRYWDPDRQCYATTVFRGFTGRGVVEGTFRTTFDCGAGEASGNWRIEKKSARR
ncbi:MAG: hypothetical protein EHM55_08955 [Acidobacteria bacterium]|nr:MAG: hypothetical protein EHM55_08955 [Acidobacteriota bacterium]